MARNYYSEINLHMVWHTKESSPLLKPKVDYVKNQKERHSRGQVVDRLERITSEAAEAEPREAP